MENPDRQRYEEEGFAGEGRDQLGIRYQAVSKGETVSMEVLMKVCKTLNCDIGDIMELIPTNEDATTESKT